MLAVENVFYEKCKKDKGEIKFCVAFTAVHFVLDGEGFFNGERLKKGQGFITYADEFANYRPDRNNPWTYLWFRIKGRDDEEILQRCGVPSANGTFSFSNSFLEENAMDIARMCNQSLNNDIAKEGVAKLLLSLCYVPNTDGAESQTKRVVKKAKLFIDENYYKKITIEQVASIVGVERKYLRNLFVKELGLSPKEYLMKKRIDKAKFLLERNDVNVSMVAFSVGYEDVLDFSRIFKKHVGVSPTRYKESLS